MEAIGTAVTSGGSGDIPLRWMRQWVTSPLQRTHLELAYEPIGVESRTALLRTANPTPRLAHTRMGQRLVPRGHHHKVVHPPEIEIKTKSYSKARVDGTRAQIPKPELRKQTLIQGMN